MIKKEETVVLPSPLPWILAGVTPATSPSDAALEATFGAPQGAIGWLRAGFSAGIRRRQAWCLDGLQPANQAAALWAARFFRRGVPLLFCGSMDDCHWRQGDERAPVPLFQSVESVPAAISLARQPGRAVFLVIDEAVARAWPVFDSWVEGGPAWVFRGGESAKTLESAAAICRELNAHFNGECTREEVLIVAVGGGVVMDLGGFAASVCGVRHLNMPTTLLGMVDASIGGKTGVNFAPWGKNQVGSFHFPESVILCPEFLSTLPWEELLAGGAECLKHALIARDLEAASQWSDCLAHRQIPDPGKIRTAMDLKERVVQADPHELSAATADFPETRVPRELLNLGHTTAHALEAWSMDKWGVTLRHGAAVAFGLLCKAQLLRQTDPSSSPVSEKMESVLLGSGCLLEITTWFSRRRGDPSDLKLSALWQELLPLIRQDKKLPGGESQSMGAGSVRVVGFSAQGSRYPHSPLPPVCSLDVSEEDLREAFFAAARIVRQDVDQ